MHAYRPDKLVKEPSITGLLADIFSVHPVLSGGAVLSVFAMSAIVVNAVWFQPSEHPAPMFATRTVEKTSSAEPSGSAVSKGEKVVKASLKIGKAKDETTKELLREVQAALAVRGYYTGKVDGIAGSRTKKAVEAFQQDNGLAVDGDVSVRLLTKVLLSASSTPTEVPIPSPKKKQEVEVIQVNAAPVGEVADESDRTPADPTLVSAIQAGLKNYGYDELVVDGKMGSQTSRAIQRFELDYGMTITGEASPILLQKLQEIGALKNG